MTTQGFGDGDESVSKHREAGRARSMERRVIVFHTRDREEGAQLGDEVS